MYSFLGNFYVTVLQLNVIKTNEQRKLEIRLMEFYLKYQSNSSVVELKYAVGFEAPGFENEFSLITLFIALFLRI